MGALLAWGCAAMPAGADTGSMLERQVLAALNEARTQPASLAQSLRAFRGHDHAKPVMLPGRPRDRAAGENVTAVDEAIAFLARQAPLAPVARAPLLAASASDHAADQSASGATGHVGMDGSTPGERARRHGGGDFIAELIVYGAEGASDAVRQLVVDDGVLDRGHRGIIYAPELRYAGISCGRHPAYRTMCVIDLAVTRDGRFGNPITLASRR